MQSDCSLMRSRWLILRLITGASFLAGINAFKASSYPLSSVAVSPFLCRPVSKASLTRRKAATIDEAAGRYEPEVPEDPSSPSDGPWWTHYEIPDEALARSVRSDFAILCGDETIKDPSLVYLDSAATSQKPRFVTDALQSYYESANGNVHRGAHALSREATRLYEGARDSVASLVNAYSRREIVFTSGATEALNLVASCHPFKEGDEVILSVAEHHSNLVPWQMAAERIPGLVLRYVPLTEDGFSLDMEAFASMLNERTALVSIQHASNVLGAVHPVSEMVRLVRETSPECKILLDGCQSVPNMPVDVQALGIDYLAASGHKMCGPTGIGFLWGREDFLNSLPPYRGGGEMIETVTLEGSTYAPAPGRFEAGTPPIAQAVGLGAAIQYLTSDRVGGMNRIHAYQIALGDYLHRRLAEVKGLRILGPTSGHVASFVVDGKDDDGVVVHPSDISTFLDAEGVAVRAGHHCCQPLHAALGVTHSARVSLYFYNTKEDVDTFVSKLEETLSFFRDAATGNDDLLALDDKDNIFL